MSKLKAYICGPITDMPGLNLDEFRAVESILTEMGYNTIVPHDLFEGIDTKDFTHDDYMDECLKAIRTQNVDYLIVLDGWQNSKGSKMEIELADELGIPVRFARNDLAAYANSRALADL